jgi:hypothetical protein
MVVLAEYLVIQAVAVLVDILAMVVMAEPLTILEVRVAVAAAVAVAVLVITRLVAQLGVEEVAV